VTLPELPDNLKPISLLIEVCQQLEAIKSSHFRSLAEIQDDFLSVARHMQGKSIDKIFSCSYSLDLLLDKYKGYAHDYETLEQRIQFLEKENFDLKKELTEKQAVTSYLQEQTKFQA